MQILSLLTGYALPFIIVISILVFVHELGHYLAARYNKVRVEAFSIGFGPEIFGWTDSAGTRWKISIIPFGGYVRMFSDLNAASQPDQNLIASMSEEDKSASLFHKTVWQRMAVSVAGPLANYIFAIAVLAGLYTTIGQKVPADEPRIGSIVKDSPAEKAGLQKGDIFVSVNGQFINTFAQMQNIVRTKGDQSLKVTVMRQDAEKDLTITPLVKEIKDEKGNLIKIGLLGVGVDSDHVKHSLLSSVWYATKDSYILSRDTILALGRLTSSDEIGGPLRIAQMAGEVAQSGWVNIIWLLAYISINLGLINLFPIPMLDGGHLLFYGIEAIRGKPLSEKAQEIGFRIGFAFVITLMLFATVNDLSHLKVFQSIKALFVS